MIAWFTKNHVAANLLMIVIVIAGVFSLKTQIPLEIFPSVEPNVISVSVSLRGSSPEDAEQGLAMRIENSVADLEGIKELSSRSVEGGSTVTIEVEDDYDPRELLADVKARVDEINTFPVEAEKPVVALAIRKREVITVAISGKLSEQELRRYAEKVRDDLLQISGITQLELVGVRNYEMTVEVGKNTLREYNLALEDIAGKVGEDSLDLSAGNVKTEAGEILVRSKGQAYVRNEFEAIPIKTNTDGSVIELGTVATVRDGFEETPLRSRFNGELAVMIEVYRVGDQSAIEVAEKVREYIASQQERLPQGMSLSYWDDDSEIVKGRLSTLISNAMQGGILVLALLSLFLRPSIAFWVFLGIPVSFMGAFILMPFFGVTLNIMSLFGFILVLGIVVDDAIVTGENVYSHLEHSENGLQAAINGTREVAVPVTFGILTTVAAFMPIAFMEGGRGAFFSQIPFIVVPVLIFSLIESKLVLPAHLKNVRLKKDQGRLSQWQQRFAKGFERFVLTSYKPLLAMALRNRLNTLLLFCGVFGLILALIMTGWTRFIFFPRIQSDTARATVVMPAGSSFETTDQVVLRMVNAAQTIQDRYRDEETGESVVLNIYSSTGHRGKAENGNVRFELLASEKRDPSLSTNRLVREWRQLIGEVAGAESLTFRAEIGRSSDPIDVRLSSNNVADLDSMAQQLKARLASYPTVFDISDNLSDGKEELRLELTRQAKALGISRSQIIRQVRQNFFGIEVQRIQRGRDEVRVMVRLLANERKAINDLRNIDIKTPAGLIPLDELAQLNPDRGAAAIYRINQRRTVSVIADFDKNNTNATVLYRDLGDFLEDLKGQYPGSNFSLEGEAQEQRDSFSSLGIGVAMVLFVIYALLAIPFGSYSQPLIVMSIIPFGAIGAIVGHWIMGMDLTIMSLLGLLALVGVVVNDSLVLVEFCNRRREELEKTMSSAQALMESVLQAGAARFRPVMLTSLTTFLGLMPLLFEKAVQAQFLIPMAVSLGFGILFATLVTLILVPVNIMLLESAKAFYRDEPKQVVEA